MYSKECHQLDIRTASSESPVLVFIFFEKSLLPCTFVNLLLSLTLFDDVLFCLGLIVILIFTA